MPRAKSGVQDLTPETAAQKKRKTDPFMGLKIEDCIPYTTDEDLPEDEVIYTETKNNQGQKVVSRKIYCGEPRFFMEQNVRAGGDWYNLIGRYRNGKGVGQRNIRTIKPKDETRLGSASPVLVERVRQDNKMLKVLMGLKIPVVVKRSATL